jgi:hypothetical protein
MPTFAHTVQTTPTRVLLANPERVSYTIQNTSVEDVYVGKSREVATSGFKTGMKISAGGDSIEDEFHKGEVWIVAASSVSVVVTEDVKGEQV